MRKSDIQKQNIERKKRIVEQAEQSGAIEKVVQLMSAVYLLNSEAAVLRDDIEELLEENGLKLGRLGYTSKKLEEATEKYFKDFGKLVSKGQNVNWANDLAAFDKMFREFAGLDTNNI